MHLQWLLLACLAWQAESQAIPGVEEFPLTDLDIEIAKTATAPAISIINQKNQTCLLTKRYVPARSGECTWRIRRRCTMKAVVNKIPVYDEGCLVDDKGIHSKDCKEILRPVPTQHSLKICNSTATPVCPAPCPNCAIHCRSTQSFWSETSHLIKMEVMTRKSCLLGEEKDCSGHILREEREVVEEVTNHYEKKGKICAPLNCKFKASDGNQHCAENNDTVLIQLRTKLCTVCEPKLEENLKSVENCGDISTKDCIGDPLTKPWKKFCTNRKKEKITFADSISMTEINKKSSEKERSNGKPETNTIFDNLFSKSLNPVNSLFQRTLGNHAHSSERKERKLSGSSDDSKRLINGNHIQENGAEDVKIKFNFVNEFQQNSSGNNFPPVLNSRNNFYTKNEEPELEISVEPTLKTAPTTRSEVKTKVITKETTPISKLTITTSAPSITTTSLQSTFTSSTLKYATISTTKTSTPITSADTTLSTILPINSRTKTRVTPKTTKAFMAKTATPETTVLPNAIFLTTSTPVLLLSSSKPHNKILLSDFLKRCFQDFTDPSCTFSESVHHHTPIVGPQTTARVKEKKTTQATSTKSLARKLKEFNLLFQSTTPTTRRRDTTTTTTRSTTAHPINKKAEAIKAKVQAELRAAFFG